MAEHLTQTDGEELCEFVAETNPGIRVAVIADALSGDPPRSRRTEPRAAVDATSDDTLERSLRGFVDAVHTRRRPAADAPRGCGYTISMNIVVGSSSSAFTSCRNIAPSQPSARR